MATFRQRGSTWRAEVYRNRRRASGTFNTKRQAIAWAQEKERELLALPMAPRRPLGELVPVMNANAAASAAAAVFCAMRG